MLKEYDSNAPKGFLAKVAQFQGRTKLQPVEEREEVMETTSND